MLRLLVHLLAIVAAFMGPTVALAHGIDHRREVRATHDVEARAAGDVVFGACEAATPDAEHGWLHEARPASCATPVAVLPRLTCLPVASVVRVAGAGVISWRTAAPPAERGDGHEQPRAPPVG